MKFKINYEALRRVGDHKAFWKYVTIQWRLDAEKDGHWVALSINQSLGIPVDELKKSLILHLESEFGYVPPSAIDLARILNQSDSEGYNIDLICGEIEQKGVRDRIHSAGGLDYYKALRPKTAEVVRELGGMGALISLEQRKMKDKIKQIVTHLKKQAEEQKRAQLLSDAGLIGD